MAVKLLKVGGVYNTPVKEYICEEKTELPTEGVVLGDRAYVIDDCLWYVYSESQKAWVSETAVK